MSAETILHRLQRNGAERPNALAYHEKRAGSWRPTTWGQYLEQVRLAARALISLGVKAGDTVTILGFNRPEWVIMDLATMMIGGAPAGIYATNSPHEVKYIIEHAESSVILLEDEGQLNKIRSVKEDLPILKHVVMMRDNPDYPESYVMSWEEFMERGNSVPESEVDTRLNSLKLDQLATLIYTSGTTGPPKGVMLSHENLAWTAETSQSLLQLGPTDSVLSYLPLSHIAEQMFTIHAAITAGYQVYYAESGLKVADNLKEVKPTVVFGVPRVWERFHAGVSSRLAEAEGTKAKIAAWARGVGTRYNAVLNRGEQPGPLLALQHALADRLVFSKLKAALGLDNIRHGISGAAPIQKEILEFFSSLDIPIYEVYGQSEDCGPTSTNRPGAAKFGTVGQKWPGTEVKIAEDGEILVHGPNVFLGYYKNPEATAEDLIDGWLHSGDLGQFDSEGYLSIIGRKKEIIITSGGKNIAPKNIEASLKNIPLVGDAVVIGEQRRFITALVSLEPQACAAFCAQNGIPNDGEVHKHPKIREEIQKGIEEHVNKYFAKVEQVRNFTILPRPLSVEDGELTPTLKVKRRVVNEHFADEIESMYRE